MEAIGSSSHQKLLVTARQAAKMLSVSERTLWGLSDAGEIPRVKIGRAVRYSVDDLKRYIAEQVELQRCVS